MHWIVIWISILRSFWCCELVINSFGVWCLHISNLHSYLQNSSKLPELWHFKAMDWDQMPARQIQWIWETCWHLPVLTLSPIFLLSISSLALIRGIVILHSSSRFKQTLSNAFHPSSSPSLTHIHKSRPFNFCAQIYFSTLTPLSNQSGSYSKMKTCLSGVLSALSGHVQKYFSALCSVWHTSHTFYKFT